LDYWGVLVAACLWNTSVEAVSGGGPSADCVLKYVGSSSWVEVKKGFDCVIEHTVKVAKQQGWFNRPVVCGVDFHDDLYYGLECFGVMGCMSKQGTNKCFRVATLEVCEPGRRFTLAVMPVLYDTTKKEVLEYLVGEARKHVKIKTLLLDRQFHSISVFHTLDKLRLKYIVCAKKTQKLLEEVEGQTHTKYTLNSSNGSYTVNLTVHRPDTEDIWVYATNLQQKPEHIAWLYKRRWGIETGYRSKNRYTANTTSKNYTIRILLMLLAMTLYNLWVLTNLHADTQTIKNLKPKTKYTTKTTIFQFKQNCITQLADHG
jgi:hypothetical protein